MGRRGSLFDSCDANNLINMDDEWVALHLDGGVGNKGYSDGTAEIDRWKAHSDSISVI